MLLITALFLKIRPKCSLSAKISSCMGRYTPAESTKYRMGMRFSMAISWARRFFLPVIGNHAPAFTVASLATTRQVRPAIRPSTTTTPAEGHPPCSAYIPSAAKAPISTEGAPGSRRRLTRSRALSLPCSASFSRRFLPPPRETSFHLLRHSDTKSLISSALRSVRRSFAMTKKGSKKVFRR